MPLRVLTFAKPPWSLQTIQIVPQLLIILSCPFVVGGHVLFQIVKINYTIANDASHKTHSIFCFSNLSIEKNRLSTVNLSKR